MGYRSRIRYNQRNKARLYGGYAGAYTDEEGKSWLQQQVAADPNFVKNSDQSQWGRDAYYHWKDQANGGQSLPNVNNLPMPGASVSPSAQQQAMQYTTNPDNGLVIKTKYQTVWLNGDPGQQALFANPDQVKSGQAAWTDVLVVDRKAILSDPNFKLSDYDQQTQQAIIQDPNFSWDKIADWQKPFYEISSNPKVMASPMALAGAKAGSGFGPIGTAIGAGAGYTFGVIGGQDFNAAGGYKDQPTPAAKVMWLLNELAQRAEQAAGYSTTSLAQYVGTPENKARNKEWMSDPKNRDVLWEASRTTWDYGIGSTMQNVLPMTEGIWERLKADFKDPSTVEKIMEEYKAQGGKAGTWDAFTYLSQRLDPKLQFAQAGEGFIIGQNESVQLGDTAKAGVFGEQLNVAAKIASEAQYIRDEVDKGRSPNEVVNEVMMRAQGTVGGQVGDFVGQAVIDPLEMLAPAAMKVGEGVTHLTGNKVAEAAFHGSKGFKEGRNKYKTLVQTDKASTIDPNFKYENMNWLSKQMAGITLDSDGKPVVRAGGLLGIKRGGLLDKVSGEAEARPVAWKDPKGFVKMLLSQDPRSRAEQGLTMFQDNITAMLSSYGNTREGVREFGKAMRALANNDMETWAQMGGQFANSPEFYTVLPALKDANMTKIDAILQLMDGTEVNSDYLKTIQDILGDTKGRLIDDIGRRGTGQQDFARLIEKAKNSTDPRAKGLLAEIEAGKFNLDTFKQVVDVFTGDGALPRTPEHWKALIGAELADHFGNWAADRMALDKSPEAKSAFFRTMGIMKTAQSILLLGGSPGYAITNGLSGMLHLAASGIYGFMDTDFMDRLGVKPSRMEEGVGIGGVVEAKTSSKGGAAIADAVKGKGPLTTVKQIAGKLSSGMPMSKLSSWFEKKNGQRAFGVGMKDMWSQSWRRGVGFSKMSSALQAECKRIGINPDYIYSAFEGSLNHAEMERALFGHEVKSVQSRSLVDNAARLLGREASKEAAMLERLGVLDQLDSYLRGQTTADGINAAFEKAERVAKDQITIRRGEDIIRKADHIKQRVGLEGGVAALDVAQQAHMAFTDTWMEHYIEFGDLNERIKDIPDPKMQAAEYKRSYARSDESFVGMWVDNATIFKGVFDVWGQSGNPDALQFLKSMGDGSGAMKGAYDVLRKLRDEHFSTNWNGDIDAMYANWDRIQPLIDKAMKEGFAKKKIADVKMGESLTKIYKDLYGPAAGEAARAWWDDVIKFNDEIRTKQDDFFKSLAGKNKVERASASKEYYSQNKMIQIAELQKINDEGIARLERIIKASGQGMVDGGPQTPPQTPSAPDTVTSDISQSQTPDQQSARVIAKAEAGQKQAQVDRVDEFNALMEAAEQRKGAEARESADRMAGVWDVAEEYWGRGGNYSRAILQDKFALLAALHKQEYGGIADLKGLNDPRLTPEIVRSVLEARKIAKETAGAEAAAKTLTAPGSTGRRFDVTKINEDTTVLRAIALHGGLDMSIAKDLTGEKRPKSAPGVFTKKGLNIDKMARMLADDGYPIDVNRIDDPGGIQQATELISKARAGNKVYPMGHDFTKDLTAAEAAYIDGFNFDNVQEIDPALWQTEFTDTLARGDLTKMWGMIGEYPDSFDPAALDGYIRMADETAARVEAEARDVEIVQHLTRAEEAIAQAETRAEAAMTRNLLKEKFLESFGDKVSEARIEDWMEVSDAVINHFARLTGEEADALYNRYYGDSVKAEGDGLGTVDGLKQAYNRIEIAERAITPEDAQNYARMLVRGGETELRNAIRNEPNKADRIAILDAAHKLDAALAERVAKGEMDVLLQADQQAGRVQRSAKGAVTFDADGIKATIHAFEAADFTTLVHENGHVFRRMLADVAERTDNPYIKADLATIEEWAGVKDGAWDRAAEEKFARGFERYITEGKAPTPALVKAFRSFKNWMLEIYKTITGSAIDVKMSQDVKDVFGRMMGADGQTVDGMSGTKLKVGDRVSFGDKQMDIVNILEDGRAVLENELGDTVIARPGQFDKLIELKIEIDQAAREREVQSVKAGMESSGILEKLRQAREQTAKLRGTADAFFQEADINLAGEQPFGSLDAAAGDNGLFHGEVMDEGWRTQVQPLMDAMKQGALESLNNKPLDGAVMDMSPEGQKMLRQYMKQAQNEMASTKLASMKWGETKRDEALLNYGKRYGIDRYAEAIYPYQFFYTRSMGAWAARAIDKPAWFANYARIKRQQDRYERDIPERLRGKIKISMPWMPDWMGDSMYIDPMANLFTPANYLKPFERMQKDSTMQQQEAERILQEWSHDGTTSQAELTEALQTRSGTTWERAFAEAQIRRESEIANPMDFFNAMFGPAWYLTTPMKLLNGEANQVTSTPLLNTTRAIDTVTQGTWAEGAGNAIGWIGRPEQWLQKKLGIPEFGEYGDYYIDRQLANMAAEGKSAEEVQIAMIERKGPLFDEARERVKLELAMKVPTMAALMAGLTADNFAQGVGRVATTLPASLFGASLLPAGEIEFRGLKPEWNEAWKKADAGDKTAIPEFFDEHPEYQAYLARGKPPEDRLRSFLIGQIWDGYMELGATDQKAARAQMGDLFAQSFLDTETRSYETLDVETLTQWARMFGKKTPVQMVDGGQRTEIESNDTPKLDLYSSSVTAITDQFFEERKKNFPSYYEQQQGYYALPKSARAAYLLKNPEYKKYLDWKYSWYDAYPQYQPIFNGQAFKTVDTSNWPPALEDYVTAYAYTGKRMPSGAYAALQQVWIMEGSPMGDFETWLDSTVVPAMKYDGGSDE